MATSAGKAIGRKTKGAAGTRTFQASSKGGVKKIKGVTRSAGKIVSKSKNSGTVVASGKGGRGRTTTRGGK